jgi:hypothetical protein
MEFLRTSEREFSNTVPATIWSPLLQQVPVEHTSPGFFSSVSDLVEVENLIPNPLADGSGIDESATSGFFNVDRQDTLHQYWFWRPRSMSLLFYWNEDWRRPQTLFGGAFHCCPGGG